MMKTSPTTTRRRFAGLITAGMLAGSALAVTAPLAPASAVDNLRTCHSQQVFSEDRTQRASFTLCATTSTGSPVPSVSYTVKATDLQYFWNGRWNDNTYPVSMAGNATLQRDGRTIDSQYVAASTITDSIEASGHFAVGSAGTYTVQVQLSTTGQFWSVSRDSSALQSEPIASSVVVAVN